MCSLGILFLNLYFVHESSFRFVVVSICIVFVLLSILIVIVLVGSMKIRLTGNPTKKAVVEVFTGGSRWSRICPIQWTLKYAQRVCIHFGYTTALSATDIISDDSTYIRNGSTTRNMIQMRSERYCQESTISSILTNCVIREMNLDCECLTLNAGVICGTGKNNSFCSCPLHYFACYYRLRMFHC